MTDESNNGWDVLEIDGVTSVARVAARKVAEQYGHTIEAEDAEQEALIVMAMRADEVRAVLAKGGTNLLHHWVWCRLVDLVKTEANHRAKHTSFEAAREGYE